MKNYEKLLTGPNPWVYHSLKFRVRYFRGRVSNFNLSEARKQGFIASDWLKFETLPRKYRTLLLDINTF